MLNALTLMYNVNDNVSANSNSACVGQIFTSHEDDQTIPLTIFDEDILGYVPFNRSHRISRTLSALKHKN